MKTLAAFRRFAARPSHLSSVVISLCAVGYQCNAQSRDTRYDDTSILVRFHERANEIDELFVRVLSQGEIEWRSTVVPSICMIRLHEPGARQALERLRLSDALLYAELNPSDDEALSGPCPAFPLTNDTLYSQQWAINNTGQFGGTIGSDMHLDCAWSITQGAGQVIGVMDEGFGADPNGLEFDGRIWTNAAELTGVAGTDDDLNGWVDDVYGYDFNLDAGDIFANTVHGTSVASVIATNRNNSIGVAGVAPQAKVMILKMVGGGFGNPITPEMFMKAIEYGMIHGVKTFNISRIYPDSWSQAWYDHCKMIADYGVVIVCGAGNDGTNLNVHIGTGYIPATFGATLPNVITVAGTSPTDQLFSPATGSTITSSYGSQVALLASPGQNIWACDNDDQQGNPVFGLHDGTSYSAPNVAGVVALIRATHPTWTPTQIRNRLQSSVRPVAGLAGTTIAGGVVDAWAAVQP